MRVIDQIYINGEFTTPHGTELFDLYNPATGQVIGRVRLGDQEDTRRAIAARTAWAPLRLRNMPNAILSPPWYS